MEKNSQAINFFEESVREKIYTLHLKPPTLKKFFRFSQTELKDSPEECFKRISEFLWEHKDQIQSYTFDNWIDSETFATVLMLEMDLVDPISKHIYPKNLLFDLLNPNQKSMVLRERIQNIMLLYEWEFNTEETRKEICERLSTVLSGILIIDKTTPEIVDSQKMDFYVEYKGNELTLMEYIHLVSLGE
jgi:hypothetical protein